MLRNSCFCFDAFVISALLVFAFETGCCGGFVVPYPGIRIDEEWVTQIQINVTQAGIRNRYWHEMELLPVVCIIISSLHPPPTCRLWINMI